MSLLRGKISHAKYFLVLTFWISTAGHFGENHVFGPITDASGLASVGSSFGIPSIVNFNGVAYNSSTRGTLPVLFNESATRGFKNTPDLYGGIWNGSTIPSRTRVQGRYPQPSGFSSNYTLTQQGLTANVICQAHDGSTLPTLTECSQASNVSWASLNVTSWNYTTTCAHGKSGEFGPLYLFLDRSVICLPSVQCSHRSGIHESYCCGVMQ